MIAGTLAKLDPVDERLESWCRDSGFPVLDVTRTQSTVGDATPQSGQAATRVREKRQTVNVNTEKASFTTGREEMMDEFATDWYADVTGSGLVLAESVTDPEDELSFPFDLISTQAGNEVDRLAIDVPRLHDAWSDAGVLTDVWMTGTATDGVEASLNYHQAADEDDDATIGLGFKRGWNGTIIRGVVYEAGYAALYSANHASEGLQFLADELLPYTRTWDGDEFSDQTDFDEFGGGGG